jgi:hypothetical protein
LLPFRIRGLADGVAILWRWRGQLHAQVKPPAYVIGEINVNPQLGRRLSAGCARHRADFDALKAQIEQLQAEVTKLETEKGAIEAIAAGHRADQSQFWMRLRTRRQATASEQFRANALPRPEEPIMQLESIQSIPAAAGRVRTFAEVAALVMFAALITAFVEYGIPFLVR